MLADPAAQNQLLELAEIDTRVRQADRRKRTLPEHQELQTRNATRLAIADKLVALQTQLSDQNVLLERTESDLNPAKQRLERDQKRLDDGQVTGQKAIASTMDEIAHLKGRISDLEDEQLEIMQVIEDATAESEKLTAQKAEIETKMRELIASRDEAIAGIDQELAELGQRRAQVTDRLPADLLALYEQIAAKQGTGAAKLLGNKCGGCGLQLDASNLTEINAAPPTEVFRCEECGRILVRGSRSSQ
jgi:predicted  nucleic acid-binding Zn-ribbon protein